MAFRATNILLSKAYQLAKQNAAGIKTYSTGAVSRLAGGGTSDDVLNVLIQLISYRRNLTNIRNTPGIANYAQTQEDDPAYDVAAEFTALLALIQTGIDLIVNTFPTQNVGGTEYMLAYTLNPDGSQTPRAFTAASLAALRTNLSNIASAVS